VRGWEDAWCIVWDVRGMGRTLGTGRMGESRGRSLEEG
jgi:hypothetical protein